MTVVIELDSKFDTALAACKDIDPDIFYPVSETDIDEPKRICSQCPIKKACLEYALSHREKYGVWGGASERERIRMIRRRRKK